MNFSQMHERLRLDLLRRIERGTLSVSLLARQTGFGQSHLSNFLRRKRLLSLEALDRVLASQHLTAADLLPSLARSEWSGSDELHDVPIVSYPAAAHESVVRPATGLKLLRVPGDVLEQARPRPSNPGRKTWLRFVAVRVSPGDAEAMKPVLAAEAFVVLDRHYNSLRQYDPSRPNLYAVRHDGALKLRYADFQAGRLLLLPYNRAAAVEALAPASDESPGELIVGRVVLVINEL